MRSPNPGDCAPCSAPLNLGALARAESDRRKEKLRRPGDYRSRGRRRHALRVSLAQLLVSRCRSINAADQFGSIVTHGPSPSSLAGGCAVRLELSVRQRTLACAIESVRVEQQGSVPGHAISPVQADMLHQGWLGPSPNLGRSRTTGPVANGRLGGYSTYPMSSR
jgi:hypothetical protein